MTSLRTHLLEECFSSFSPTFKIECFKINKICIPVCFTPHLLSHPCCRKTATFSTAFPHLLTANHHRTIFCIDFQCCTAITWKTTRVPHVWNPLSLSCCQQQITKGHVTVAHLIAGCNIVHFQRDVGVIVIVTAYLRGQTCIVPTAIARLPSTVDFPRVCCHFRDVAVDRLTGLKASYVGTVPR